MDSKLLFSHKLGKRTSDTTDLFIADVAKRLYRTPGQTDEHTPQFSTDGFAPYQTAIRENFGESAKHGVLIKSYVNPESGRYQPPDFVKADRINVQGIKRLATICTNHVERCNLTIRTFIRRFTRLCLGFNKKLENLVAATADRTAS